MKTKKKIIRQVCHTCGIKHGNGKIETKGAIGSWMGICDICGAQNVPCASASHDYGIYSNAKIKTWDKFQDLI